MTIKILCFGITRDILGSFEHQVEMPKNSTIADLKQELSNNYPEFGKLVSLRIALNSEYADEDTIIKANDEIVLIPPVSGG